MERGNPAKGHMTAPYDPIDSPFEGKDASYTEEEPEETKEKGTTAWV